MFPSTIMRILGYCIKKNAGWKRQDAHRIVFLNVYAQLNRISFF